MIRFALLLSASLLALPLAANAQSPAPAATTAGQGQLDRIEGKLDEVLRRLDQPRAQPSGIAQGQATPFEGAIPLPCPRYGCRGVCGGV